MKISRLLEVIDNFFPRKTAMDGDRIGLQVQAGNDEVRKVLITMELNSEVITEASVNHCDCIITFHPLIFHPITSINNADRVGSLITHLIEKRITLISVHTNFDAYAQGSNRLFADRLNLPEGEFLVPDDEFIGHGMGLIFRLQDEITIDELLKRVKSACNSPIRFSAGQSEKIKNIAMVCGSGSSFIDEAYSAGADAFITADISYHHFHKMNGRMALIDPGHYEMEQFVADGLMKILKQGIRDEDTDSIQLSKVHTNPVMYFPDDGTYINEQKEFLINIEG
jgi:dinuclear metal center YbgI/SA1388 family protein